MNGSISLDKINEVILPIFIVSEGDPITFLGMGFTIADNLLVTCWHCVDIELEENQQIAAIIVREGGQDHTVLYLENIQQDANRLDLATAIHGYKLSCQFEISSENIAIGRDIWTYGRPYTIKQRAGDKIKFDSPLIFLKGYITRTLNHNHQEYGIMPSFEMNFAPPKGMSGAPILLLGTTKIIGVIHGSNDVSVIEQTKYVDPDTGKAEPEIQRILSYGLAHHTISLKNLIGIATGGLALNKYLEYKK